ncbi:hypothetical protein JR316_0010728 [Psilocybe cubensis]|uniref:Uncharacterized protein n=2 Tax=Psilocybe cubensis TaxID=181762 RepID=A0ACB8GMD7_PSICU|nr:hypothetical protein JR316_0010728 [Psilocybe cubensis]KAH9476813.1 hypothetical protein JR316_0010728 [Psilocybe cubensis]
MSSFPTPTFNDTLQSIAIAKLEEIEKQRVAYGNAIASIFAKKENMVKTNGAPVSVVADKEDLLKRIEHLIEAVKQWNGAGKLHGTTVGGRLELSNLEFGIKQAREEVGFDMKIIRGWEETLEGHVQHISNRLQMAKLAGEMYLEYLSSGDSEVPYYGGRLPGSGGVEEDEDFDMLSDAPGEHSKSSENMNQDSDDAERKARIAHEKFVSTAFEEHTTSFSNLFDYLDNLFEPEEVTQALAEVRASNYRFGVQFDAEHIGDSIHDILEDLLTSGLVDGQQREVIEHIQGNPTARDQVISIATMRVLNIDTWSWPKEGVKVAIRSQRSDEFCVSIEPELIDAIVLQFIGKKWKVQLKMACTQFFYSSGWKRKAYSITQEHAKSKVSMLSKQANGQSIDDIREQTFRQVFLLSDLNDIGHHRLDRHSDFINMPESDMWQREKQSAVAARRQALHLMAAESRLNSLIHGCHAMVHSVITNLASCLPHESILIVLAYLGVPQKWVTFFQTSLAVPVILPGETVPRVCKRGIPSGYASSTFFTETIMFIMDVAVNRRTKGLRLYRIHDEMWFWDSDVKKCVKAWKAMCEYAAIIGVKFDDKKSGAVYSGPPTAEEALLPKGEVKWGLLKFDSGTLNFVVNQTEVDLQITEFRRQLDATKSVIGWVQIYNRYMAHLSRHFGGVPVNGLGSALVGDLIKAYKKVQNGLFEEPNIGPTGYLRNRIIKQFGAHDFPEGYFYFPVAAGGLQLFNPTLLCSALQTPYAPSDSTHFLPPPGFKSSLDSSTAGVAIENLPIDTKLRRQCFSDLNDYQHLRVEWEQVLSLGPKKVGQGNFISFHEYVALRECGLVTWGRLYSEMFNTPSIREVALVQVGTDRGRRSSMVRSTQKDFRGLYTRWIEALYGDDVASKFGSLDILDQSLIFANADYKMLV